MKHWGINKQPLYLPDDDEDEDEVDGEFRRPI